MLHAAPVNETKTETMQSRHLLTVQPERALHQHAFSTAVAYSLAGPARAASTPFPQAQPYHALNGLQRAYGNQTVLRILHSPLQIARMPALRPSQSLILQRQCACGGSSESEGECAECKAKREATLQSDLSNEAISPKLVINRPGDSSEQEADSVAEQVMRMPVRNVQRHAGNQAAPAGANTVPRIVHEVLRSSGEPLDAATRGFMEPRFGQDFSHVRVHIDAKAAKSARAVNALAYTLGQDIVFGTEQYAPSRDEGRILLAHELTHVVQQGSGKQNNAGSIMRQESECKENCESEYDTCCDPCRISHDPNCYAECMNELARCYRRCNEEEKAKALERIREIVPLAILVLLAAAGLIALIACFATGVCEVAAIVAGLSLATAVIVLGVLKGLGIIDSGSGGVAAAESSSQGGPSTATVNNQIGSSEEIAV